MWCVWKTTTGREKVKVQRLASLGATARPTKAECGGLRDGAQYLHSASCAHAIAARHSLMATLARFPRAGLPPPAVGTGGGPGALMRRGGVAWMVERAWSSRSEKSTGLWWTIPAVERLPRSCASQSMRCRGRGNREDASTRARARAWAAALSLPVSPRFEGVAQSHKQWKREHAVQEEAMIAGVPSTTCSKEATRSASPETRGRDPGLEHVSYETAIASLRLTRCIH